MLERYITVSFLLQYRKKSGCKVIETFGVFSPIAAISMTEVKENWQHSPRKVSRGKKQNKTN